MDFITGPAISLIHIKYSDFGRFKKEKKTGYLLAKSHIDVQCVSGVVTIYFNRVVVTDMVPPPVPTLIYPKNSNTSISITLPEFKNTPFADAEIAKDQLVNFLDNDTIHQIVITEMNDNVYIDLVSRCNIEYCVNLHNSVVSINSMEVNNNGNE